MKAIVLAAARIFVGGVLLYAAWTKVPDMAAFARDVANYRLLPAWTVALTAAAVVGVEIVAGAALVLGVWVRPAAAVAAALLAVFTAGIAQALLRGIDLNCGCFGTPERATWLSVARDVALFLPAAAVARFGGGRG